MVLKPITLQYFKKVQCLQLGKNFFLPFININNNVNELIKNIENNIIKLHADIQLIHNFMSPFPKDYTDVKII